MAQDYLIPVNDPDSAIGAGWFIEVDGRRVAELVEPMYVSGSQFWYSYIIKPAVDDPAEQARLFKKEFWDSDQAVFRSRKFGVVVEGVLTSQNGPNPETRRIAARCLTLQLGPGPSLVERFLGLFKRL